MAGDSVENNRHTRKIIVTKIRLACRRKMSTRQSSLRFDSVVSACFFAKKQEILAVLTLNVLAWVSGCQS